MPYIGQKKREEIEPELSALIETLLCYDDNEIKGALNYTIFVMIKRIIKKRGLRYFRAQDLIGGVLTCCQAELYRKVLAEYEEDAISRNGDVE